MTEFAELNEGGAVPRSVFDTGAISRRRAFEFWQEQLEPMGEARLAKDIEADFSAFVETVVLDKIVVENVRVTTQIFDRSRFRIARHGIDHYVLHFFAKGRLICQQTEAGDKFKPGDLLVADMTHPQRMALIDIDLLHVAVPRPLLAPLLVEPDAYAMRHIPGDGILVRLLRDHMYSLISHANNLTPREACALLPAFLELAAAAINGAVAERTAPGVAWSLTQAIRRHVGVHALDADLTPGKIAARFGISPRKLSYLFQEQGGIATFIQHERLRLARNALMDPAQRGRTVAEIAEAHGFSHRTSFIRAYERVYSLSPGQQRALAAARLAANTDALRQSGPFRWISIP